MSKKTEPKPGRELTMSDRARMNKGKTPWRCGPHCITRNARRHFNEHHVQIDLRTPPKETEK